MTLALDPVLRPLPRRNSRSARQRQALMLGASTLFHVALFGPMILLAVGDKARFQEPTEPPIIQILLEPYRLIRPRAEPRTEQKPFHVIVPPQETTPTEAEPMPPVVEPVPEIARKPQVSEQLDTVSPTSTSDLRAVQLPSLLPEVAQEQEELSPLQDRAAPTQITTSVPSLKPLPAPETLDTPGATQTISPISRTAPSLNQSASDSPATESLSAEEQALLERRRKQEQEAANGLPSSPMPRMANPVAGAPAPSASQTSPVPGISEAWRVAPSSQEGRNARALRTSPLGCRPRERLTPSEQALCDQRFNADAAEGARTRITGSGNAERDARFAREGAREMYNYESKRRPLSGGTGNVGPQDCPGSNLGTGCAGSLLDPSMQMDSSSNIRTKRDGPPPAGRPMTPGSAGSTGRPGNGSD